MPRHTHNVLKCYTREGQLICPFLESKGRQRGTAIRLCGYTRIACRWDHSKAKYECTLSVDGQHRGREFIAPIAPAGAGPINESSIQAYDAAARRAISAALEDGFIEPGELDYHHSGSFDITRGRK